MSILRKLVPHSFFVAAVVVLSNPAVGEVYSLKGGKVDIPLGDKSFAIEVMQFDPGDPAPPADEAWSNPEFVLGSPDYSKANETGYLSMGCGGVITLRFQEDVIKSIKGPDLYIFEIGGASEPVRVEVSEDRELWIDIGDTSDEFAVDFGDIVPDGARLKYVRLTDMCRNDSQPWPGADLDAVAASGKFVPVFDSPYGGIMITVAPWAELASWNLVTTRGSAGMSEEFSGILKQVIHRGSYEFQWTQSGEDSKASLEGYTKIRKARITFVNLNTGMSLNVAEEIERPEYWGLRNIATGKLIATYTQYQNRLAPEGVYDLVWKAIDQENEIVLTTVRLYPGELSSWKLATTINPISASWLAGGIASWQLRHSDSKRDVVIVQGKFQTMPVPPGSYSIAYTPAGVDDEILIPLGDVVIPENGTTVFSVDSGIALSTNKASTPSAKLEIQAVEKSVNFDLPSPIVLQPVPDHVALAPGFYTIRVVETESDAVLALLDNSEIMQGEIIEITY